MKLGDLYMLAKRIQLQCRPPAPPTSPRLYTGSSSSLNSLEVIMSFTSGCSPAVKWAKHVKPSCVLSPVFTAGSVAVSAGLLSVGCACKKGMCWDA